MPDLRHSSVHALPPSIYAYSTGIEIGRLSKCSSVFAGSIYKLTESCDTGLFVIVDKCSSHVRIATGFIMTGPDPDSFLRALGKFKVFLSRTSPELINQFAITGPQDVKRVCMEIQDRQSRDGSLRRMRRIEGFIEAMDQLGKSIEVFVNVNELVCFVWVSASPPPGSGQLALAVPTPAKIFNSAARKHILDCGCRNSRWTLSLTGSRVQ